MTAVIYTPEASMGAGSASGYHMDGKGEYYLDSGGKPANKAGSAYDVLERDFGISRDAPLTVDQFENLYEGLRPDFDRDRLGQLAKCEKKARRLSDTNPEESQYWASQAEAVRPKREDYLVRTKGGKHAPGWDINLSPSKHISILMTLMNAEQRAHLEQVHLELVREAAAMIEKEPLARIMKDGKSERFQGSLLFHIATHHTSRPTEEGIKDGRPPDPQLHSHLFLFNLIHGPKGWQNIGDNKPVVHMVQRIEAMYRLRMNEALNDMGITTEWKMDNKGRYDIAVKGISSKLVSLFSSRTKDIHKAEAEFIHKHGRPPKNGRELASLARNSRCRKHDHSEPDWGKYRTLIRDHNLGKVRIHRHHSRNHSLKTPMDLQDRRAMVWERILGEKGFHATANEFARWSIDHTVLNACAGLLSWEEAQDLLEEVKQSDEFVVVKPSDKGTPEYDMLTTHSHLHMENEVKDFLSDKSRQEFSQVDEVHIQRASRLFREKHGFKPTDEQIQNLRQMCKGAGFMILEGPAGSAKTAEIELWILANKLAGNIDEVMTVTTAASAAHDIGDRLDADYAGPLEGLAMQAQDRNITSRTPIIVDESVTVDTYRLATYLAPYAKNAPIIFSGGIDQLQAVAAGGIHLDMLDRAEVVRFKEVFRQKNDDYKQACMALYAGAADRAVELIDSIGGLHVDDDVAEAIGSLVRQYEYDRWTLGMRADEIIMTTDMPNAVKDKVNLSIQEARLAHGELSGQKLEQLDTTIDRVKCFYEGDKVITTKGYDGNTKGWIANGKKGVVTHIDHERGTVMVWLKHRGEVELPIEVLELNYIGTAHRVQGGEAKHAYCLAGGWTMNKESAYSQITRGIQMVHVFANKAYHGENVKVGLAERMSKTELEVTASRKVDLREAMEMESVDTTFHDDVDMPDYDVPIAPTLGFFRQRFTERDANRDAIEKEEQSKKDFGIAS